MGDLLCAIHQPNFFPRLSTLAKLYTADIWIILDNAQSSRTYGSPIPPWQHGESPASSASTTSAARTVPPFSACCRTSRTRWRLRNGWQTSASTPRSRCSGR